MNGIVDGMGEIVGMAMDFVVGMGKLVSFGALVYMMETGSNIGVQRRDLCVGEFGLVTVVVAAVE
jgi:hypothetical protein